MTKLLTGGALVALLAAPLTAQQDRSPHKDKDACEVRAYLLDKDRKAVSPNGLSATLLCEDRNGNEKEIPMRVVTDKDERQKAPDCILHTRVVEGTPYVAALCAVSKKDGRLRSGEEPYRAENGGPRFDRDWDRNDSAAAGTENVKVDFDVPYFRADIPSDHVCGPDCKVAVRFMVKGQYHTTRSFPCPAGK